METFDLKLLQRSLGQKRTHQSIKPLYGHQSWVTDLDIVNELGGHTGCVNALSWATGGNLLASGSDDTYLNIWEYNPSSIARPFTLNTSVATGHHANIFSVKFMPHSGDRTVVTCAGDSEVRVFDLEYGGGDGSGDHVTASTRSRKFNDFFRNARWLNESNTNARVYRSHSDRAKRIVTESSPHLFLTCSEDGEVRQWDLRQPSSAYPSPHPYGSRRLGRLRTMQPTNEVAGDVPPPLISYKKYDIDLNSISCSASQPHYIALGGAHLHCFLHDRRMLGRDISLESGQPGGKSPTASSRSDEQMREATKCVRRFAPNNKRRMQARNAGHITACKISDARPNELISSWSGDHIYSFDIIKSPDARDAEARQEQSYLATRLRNRSERKRKRALKVEAPLNSIGERNTNDRTLHRVTNEAQEEEEEPEGHTTLRVRRANGEAGDIAGSEHSEEATLLAYNLSLTEEQLQAQRVAKALVTLRKTLFDFSALMHPGEVAAMETSNELSPFTSQFTNVLGQACSLLPEMEEIMSSWSYPVNPTSEEVELQNTLRKNRQSAWRFVQAAGVLSRVLGGRLRTMSTAPDPRLEKFDMVKPAPREKISRQSRFYYDFIKAILLWLDGGASSVLSGFMKRPNFPEAMNTRFPFDDEDDIAGFPEKLRTILHSLADEDKPVLDLDTNRFLRAEERSVFQTEQQGVSAFITALDSVELRMHQGLSEPGIYSIGAAKRVMDKGAAARFWGVKVTRSLLMEAAQGVDFAFVQQAFGGSTLRVVMDSDSSSESENLIDPLLENIINNAPTEATTTVSDSVSPAATAPQTAPSERDMEIPPPLIRPAEHDGPTEDQEQSVTLDEADEDEEQEDDNPNADSEDEDEDDDASDDEGEQGFHRSRITFSRASLRTSVNLDVPYSSHTKIYKGHCNTRTVKDVNYYGLDDEYIVSGSDDGHFFIWDRKTCQIVNILEGDGEVVNVVQGHPYEPMIACSGIDSTVKIFGAGGKSRERYRAAKGIDVANPGGSVHSSLRFGRSRRAAADDDDEQDQNQDEADRVESEDEEALAVAKKGLRSRRALGRQYEIMSQNDAERQRGIDDTYVTEGMLARFAAALHRGELQGIDEQGLGGLGGTIVIDQDNCSVM